MSEAGRDVELLSEVTRTLISVCQSGTRAGGKPVAERLRTLAKACQALRFKRLYWILEALAVRCSRPDPDMDGPALEELGRLMADARQTCKALKTYLVGRLDDPRLYDDLISSAPADSELEEIEFKSFVSVAEVESRDGDNCYRQTYLLEPHGGLLLSLRELRTLADGQLTEPFSELGPSPRILRGRIIPSFEPKRLRLESFEPGPLAEVAFRNYVAERVPDTVGGLVEAFRTQREEYLAPRTLPVFFRPRFLDPTPPATLFDREGNALPLLVDATSFPAVESLAARLDPAPQGPWAVFGRLVFVTGGFQLLPFSLLLPDETRPVLPL